MTNGSFIDDLRDVPGFNELKTRAPRDRGLVTAEEAENMIDEENDIGGRGAKKERETFPCESCGGTGRYRGVRLHQPAVECFACKGRGFYYKSFKDRQASKVKRAARKQKLKDEVVDLFAAAHADLYVGMIRHSSWNDFLARLVADLKNGKELNAGAIAAAQKAVDKANAKDAARDAERKARTENAPTVNTDALRIAFDKASAAGLKRPVLRYEGFSVSLAPATGKNAGALYVKAADTKGFDYTGGFKIEGAYLGKIVGGKYLATREAQAAGMIDKVAATMQDPLALAIAYGKRTGHCSCCGRPLVDPVSVHNGIGPICAAKFGFDLDTNVPPTKAIVQGEMKAVEPRTSTKYEYAPGMSDADKRKLRAAARRANKGN